MSATVRETTLRELVTSGAISSACAVGQQGGYSIAVQCGSTVQTLATSRGDVRLFTLERASAFLSALGITRFEVDSSRYERGRLRKPRPDRAEALRKTRTRPVQEPLL
ncbi:hypothetical protein [Burkholderia multivorans]|uniref:hypothetical protein n=1 Tax=Burkholderia multivorans TaxID=87883 RepID=UPI0012D94A25|nr:hypothetical protein [Burkholderia multivorans]MCL4629228.1 hypothetical protein [Burkholderia multivorans]MCO1388452.1 hypothetical protein [Burkholderia multivorans]UQO11629.1 hypothetical protein L0Z40_00785 [Burkholderia multivorans]UQO56492.1 hypothetical protein L0Z30_24565 [Burkholderia multivorans]UQO60114.1 hypothetical protein L0Z29_14905 [Burkholderia multivorans]